MLTWLLILFFVFLQSSFLPVDVLLAVILARQIIKIDHAFLVLVFFSGVFFDILGGRLVGASSLFYLSTLLILSLYQKKFKPKNFVYVLMSAFLIFILYEWLFYRAVFWPKIAVEIILLLVFYRLFSLGRNL